MNRAALLAPACFVALVVVFTVVLDTRNVQQLNLQLLFPADGEYVLSPDSFGVVRENLAVELNAIVPLLTLAGRLGQFSSDLTVDIRTYVLPVSMLPLVVVGAGVAIANLRSRSSARLTLFLLAVTFIGPLFSAKIGEHLSISSFRMSYLVIPLCLLVAAAAAWVIGHKVGIIQVFGCTAVVLLLAAQLSSTVAEIERHNAFLGDLAHRWQPNSQLTLFRDNGAEFATQQFEQQTNGSYQYYFLQVAPLAAAVRILDRAPVGSTGSNLVVLRLIGPVQPGHIGGATRLVFYLRSLGAPAALFDPTDHSLKGAGLGQPRYIVAEGPDSAATAVSLLRQAGREVRIVDFQWSQ